ncbi:MAG: T9SS type A sorting domain-containing protein [Ignavibacteriales bacterium]|nr:T9SS type A sorting domain-containing protein [Ignavibacteriales bacterium]
MAITQDGKYGYIGFDLSEVVFKVRLADLTVVAGADLSRYFPIESEDIALDSSEEKLFVYSPTWRKLLVLDTKTMSVIHTIDSINVFGMVRSKYGPFIMTWDGGSVVTFVNTETNELTNFRASGEFFLKILESNTNQDIWYVVSGKEPGNSELNAGIYDHKAKTWIRKVSLPTEARASSIADLRVLPNEHKAYVAIFGGWYQDNMHGYGWLHSVDLVSGGVKVVPIDGGAGCLEASPDSRWLYVGTGWPIPSTSNLLVVDTQSDSIVNQIYLGKNKHNWYYTQMNILQIDPAHPSLLYATSTDGNALVKMDLHSLALLDVLVFNEESFQPQFFVRRPGQANGFILLTNRPYAFELDLDQAIIKRNVRFPNILQNTGTNDIAFNKAGRIFIAQGGSFLEVDAQDMRLLVTHTLPPGAPWVWSFVLSKDEKHLYSVTYNDQIANKFVAMNTTTFQLEASIKLEGGVFNFRPYELPDGSKLYALGGQQNGHVVIHVIETDTYTIKKTITYEEPDRLGISAGPYYPFAYDSNSHTLFVGATHVVLAIDTDTDVIKKVIYLGDAARAIGLGLQQLTYINAIGMVYNPRENYLYIAHLDRSFVSIYNLTNDQFVLKVINLKGFYPRIMYANDDLSKIYSINIRSDNVSVIDVNSKAVETIIDLHSFPITSVRDKEVIPKEFSLSQNFPNPFNPTTTIRYTLPRTREVSLAIYNVLGQLVSRLVVGRKEAGFHEVHWDANVPSGIYFYRLQAGEYLETKKMILLR